MSGNKPKTEKELSEIELKRHVKNAFGYWSKKFDNLKERGYVVRFEIKIADPKREIIEISLPHSALQYIKNCAKIKGKNVDLVSRAIGDVFRKVGKEKEITKIIGNKVITCGCHGLAYVLKILSSFYDKINRKLDKKEKNMKEEKRRQIIGGKERVAEEAVIAMLREGYREENFYIEVYYQKNQKKYKVFIVALQKNMFVKKASFPVFSDEEVEEIIKNVF